jgi:hypothetical protein
VAPPAPPSALVCACCSGCRAAAAPPTTCAHGLCVLPAPSAAAAAAAAAAISLASQTPREVPATVHWHLSWLLLSAPPPQAAESPMPTCSGSRGCVASTSR